MSAEANLAGLFAPVGSQIWNKNLPWQPIPVHTINVSTDYLISGGVPANCPAYYNAFNAYLQTPQIKQFDSSLQSVYNYLTTSLGTTIDDWMTVLLIRDTLLCESIHNLPWVNELWKLEILLTKKVKIHKTGSRHGRNQFSPTMTNSTKQRWNTTTPLVQRHFWLNFRVDSCWRTSLTALQPKCKRHWRQTTNFMRTVHTTQLFRIS